MFLLIRKNNTYVKVYGYWSSRTIKKLYIGAITLTATIRITSLIH